MYYKPKLISGQVSSGESCTFSCWVTLSPLMYKQDYQLVELQAEKKGLLCFDKK